MGHEEMAAAPEQELVFDHERLDAYCIAREFVGRVSGFLKRKMTSELRDQLERSSTSIVFNIAEGAGKFARADKRRFYEIARGSGMEAAAQLDILHLRGVISADEYKDARGLLLRVVQMLSRLASGPRSA